MQENYKVYDISIIQDKKPWRGSKVYVARLIVMPTLDAGSGELYAPTALYTGKGYPVPTEQDAAVVHSRFGRSGEKKNPLSLPAVKLRFLIRSGCGLHCFLVAGDECHLTRQAKYV
jgi:hypothetical protein